MAAVVQAIGDQAQASGDTAQLQSDVCVLETCMQAALTPPQATTTALVQLKSPLECMEAGEAILTADGKVLERSAADDLWRQEGSTSLSRSWLATASSQAWSLTLSIIRILKESVTAVHAGVTMWSPRRRDEQTATLCQWASTVFHRITSLAANAATPTRQNNSLGSDLAYLKMRAATDVEDFAHDAPLLHFVVVRSVCRP